MPAHVSHDICEVALGNRTLIGRVERVLALEGIDHQTHGHVDDVDKDVGNKDTLPEIDTVSGVISTRGKIVIELQLTVVSSQPSVR